jgi:hypothetical protein
VNLDGDGGGERVADTRLSTECKSEVGEEYEVVFGHEEDPRWVRFCMTRRSTPRDAVLACGGWAAGVVRRPLARVCDRI